MSGTADPVKILSNIFISFIGAGVLGLPYAFRRAGIMEGVLVMILVSYFAVKAMLLIIECKYKLIDRDSNRRGRSEKLKSMNGHTYVELKCSDDDDIVPQSTKSKKSVSTSSEKVVSENSSNKLRSASKTRQRSSSRSDNGDKDDYSDGGGMEDDVMMLPPPTPGKKSKKKSSSTITNSTKTQQQLHNNSGGVDTATALQTPNDVVHYSDIGYAAFGVWGRFAIDFALLTSQIGFCCAYLIFISENLSVSFPDVEKRKWLLLLLPALFLLTLIKDLARFAIFSLFAQISNLLAFTIVYWFDFQHLHLAQVDPKEFSLEGFPYYFSVAIYCFEGAGMILSLEDSLADEVKSSFKTYFVRTITGITTLYITFGVAGYLSYGDETRDIITLNLPNGGGFNFSILVKSFLCISLFFTYPMMLFPVFSILEKKLQLSGVFYTTAIRLFIVILTGIIVMEVPNFGDLMALVGASCCTLLAYIMPALCHLALFRDELDSRSKGLDYVLVVLGVTGAIIGTADTIINFKH
eukprot:TRINITY_DN11794_c0_g1_i10.p1 TRINITY_DN11794_c0_g1~~TRINITY_DN11794_c0_g1_i10.p1  ORF type:complete len:522 (+),score=67.77 TRINITY_DN11794_c0_g1_i10:78-1643(+)